AEIPVGVTKWGPAVMTDQPPQGRFSGLRSGFPSEMVRAAAAGSEFPKGIRLKPNPTYYHVPGTVRILRSWKEGGQREVPHRVQTGCGVEHPLDGVHHDRRGRDVAVNAAHALHREVGRSFDLDHVVRLRCSEIGLEMEPDERLALP